jgi:hypothetical protein
MRFLAAIIIIISTAYAAFAAKPVVELGELLPDNQLENYENDEMLYSMKIMEYYEKALMLETQLRLMGIEPETPAIMPTLEELEDLELRTLKIFYRIAWKLNEQVLNSPDTFREKLAAQLDSCMAEMNEVRADAIIRGSEDKMKAIRKYIEKMQSQDSVYRENVEMLIDQNFEECKDYTPIISIFGNAGLFIANTEDGVINDPGLGAGISVNISKVLGFWNTFELWYRYQAPRINTEFTDANGNEISELWQVDLSAVGAGGKIYISKSESYKQGLNLGLGYFWTNGNIYNRNGPYMDWEGISMNVEYFGGISGCKYPVELFFGMSLYQSFSENLAFDAINQKFELGKTHIGFNIGLKYHIFRTPF